MSLLESCSFGLRMSDEACDDTPLQEIKECNDFIGVF